jgi:hypothetical protein
VRLGPLGEGEEVLRVRAADPLRLGGLASRNIP